MIKRKSQPRRNITGEQVRAARAILRWTAQQLADESGLGVATVRRAEAVDGPLPLTAANAEAIARTLEAAGIELLNGDAPGVRLKSRRR